MSPSELRREVWGAIEDGDLDLTPLMATYLDEVAGPLAEPHRLTRIESTKRAILLPAALDQLWPVIPALTSAFLLDLESLGIHRQDLESKLTLMAGRLIDISNGVEVLVGSTAGREQAPQTWGHSDHGDVRLDPDLEFTWHRVDRSETFRALRSLLTQALADGDEVRGLDGGIWLGRAPSGTDATGVVIDRAQMSSPGDSCWALGSAVTAATELDEAAVGGSLAGALWDGETRRVLNDPFATVFAATEGAVEFYHGVRRQVSRTEIGALNITLEAMGVPGGEAEPGEALKMLWRDSARARRYLVRHRLDGHVTMHPSIALAANGLVLPTAANRRAVADLLLAQGVSGREDALFVELRNRVRSIRRVRPGVSVELDFTRLPVGRSAVAGWLDAYDPRLRPFLDRIHGPEGPPRTPIGPYVRPQAPRVRRPLGADRA